MVDLRRYTLAENCRMLGINSEKYFIDVLSRVDDHPMSRIDELTLPGRFNQNSAVGVWAGALRKT